MDQHYTLQLYSKNTNFLILDAKFTTKKSGVVTAFYDNAAPAVDILHGTDNFYSKDQQNASITFQVQPQFAQHISKTAAISKKTLKQLAIVELHQGQINLLDSAGKSIQDNPFPINAIFQNLAPAINLTSAQQFSESPCDALKGRVLDNDAYFIATGFVPTMRVKEWKPLQPPPQVPQNASYCYFEQSDPVVSGPNSCAALTNTPFISRAFTDSNQEITKPVATNKCVFQIDQEAATDASLSAFWKTMGSNDCKFMVTSYQEKNAGFAQQITSLTETHRKLVERDDVLSRTLTQSNAQAAQLDRAIETNRQEIEMLRGQIETQTALYGRFVQQETDADASCSTNFAALKKVKEDCHVQLSYWTTAYNDANALYTKSNPIYQRLQVDYNTNAMALSNIMQQYQIVNGQLVDLGNKYTSLSNQATECAAALNGCTSNLGVCNTDVATSKADGRAKYTLWTDCTSKLSICQNSLDACVTNTESNLKPTNKTTIRNYQICETDLRKCNDDLSKNLVTESGLRSEIDEWMRTHTTCIPFPPKIEAINSSIREIMTWCKFPMDTTKQNREATATVITTGLQSTANQIAACETGLDRVPDPPEVKTQPASSTRGSAPSPTSGIFYHHVFYYKWTNGSGGHSFAYMESISTKSAQDAIDNLNKICNKGDATKSCYDYAFDNRFRNIEWREQPTSYANTNPSYEYHLDAHTVAWCWVIRTGSPTDGEMNKLPERW